MSERSMPESRQPMQRRKRWKRVIPVSFVVLRLALSFACGWFLSVLVANHDGGELTQDSLLLFLGFPPILGILAATTVSERNPHFFSLSLATGLPAIAGIYAYWFPFASQQDSALNAYCAESGIHCHVGPADMALLNFFLLYGGVLVLLGAGIIGYLMRPKRAKKSPHPLDATTDE